jgi:hypothetical protein
MLNVVAPTTQYLAFNEATYCLINNREAEIII